MSKDNNLHIQAMDIAEDAFTLQRKGDEENARKLFKQALDLEQQAAYLLEVKIENEPSRSILFRSAASLAFNAGEFEKAEKLVAQGLIGFPPSEIGEELRDIFDEVTFERHLSTKGMELSDSEWKMTLTGAAIAKGIAQADQLLVRVEKVSTLVRRTVERKLHLPFQINRSSPDERNDRYGLFVKALLPSSFAVVFRLGKPDQQLSLITGDVEPQEIVDELLRCLENVQNDQIDQLKERIGNQDYFENFIGLAKQIAPDGKEVKAVGFTVVRNGKDKPFLVKKTRQEIKASVSKTFSQAEEEKEIVILEGVLTFANTPIGRQYGKVKLRTEEQKGQEEINVPIGLMKDVVQPYYDENVKVSVIKKNGKYYLEDVIK
jgi:hypothetical protein